MYHWSGVSRDMITPIKGNRESVRDADYYPLYYQTILVLRRAFLSLGADSQIWIYSCEIDYRFGRSEYVEM